MPPADEIRLQQPSDRAEISDVQLRYATGVDTRHWKLLRTCFTDDLEVDFSSGFGVPAARLKADAWIEAIAPVMSAFESTHHMITNHMITFDNGDEDQATCVADVQAIHHHPRGTGKVDLTVNGFYTTGLSGPRTGGRFPYAS